MFEIFLIVVGFYMVKDPELVFKIQHSLDHYGDAEPSDFYIVVTRIAGVVCLLIGLVAGIYALWLHGFIRF